MNANQCGWLQTVGSVFGLDEAKSNGDPATPKAPAAAAAAGTSAAAAAPAAVVQAVKENPGHDTVGCVALDRFGNIAAATSTGGITGKRVGRVGDSPLVGCGYVPSCACFWRLQVC